MGGKYQKASRGCQPVALDFVDRLMTCIAPWRCVFCREAAHGMDICADCLNDLPWLGHCCRRCAMPLADVAAQFCGACATCAPSVDYCFAALAYEYPVDRLVTGLKYRRELAYARVLGELLAIRMCEVLRANEVKPPTQLVPVPMHPGRLAGRRFNQAEQIARWLSKDSGIPLNLVMARRARNTPPQAGLTRAARLQNLSGAFQLRQSAVHHRIALVDDVITTGATVRELAKRCKQQGALEVQVWAVARTES
jgi:ComF family protein